MVLPCCYAAVQQFSSLRSNTFVFYLFHRPLFRYYAVSYIPTLDYWCIMNVNNIIIIIPDWNILNWFTLARSSTIFLCITDMNVWSAMSYSWATLDFLFLFADFCSSSSPESEEFFYFEPSVFVCGCAAWCIFKYPFIRLWRHFRLQLYVRSSTSANEIIDDL